MTHLLARHLANIVAAILVCVALSVAALIGV